MAKASGSKSKWKNFSVASGMPPQMLSSTAKNEAWGEACMDFMDYQSASQSQQKMDNLRKYRILSGDFKVDNYSYISDPSSIMSNSTDEKPSALQGPEKTLSEDIQHYPIMVRPINTIIGEYISRISQLHGFYAKNESPDAKNEYNRVKTEMLQEWATQQVMKAVMKKVQASGVTKGTPQYDQAIQQQTPEEIQEYVDRDYVDIAEQVCQTLLKGIWKTEGLDSEFVEGFKRACIVAEEYYHIYTVNKRTKIRNISDIDVFSHKSPSVPWVSQGQYAGFRQYLTPSSVIDMFYEDLSVDDMREIEDAISPNNRKQNKSASGNIAYDTSTYSNNFGDIANIQSAQDLIGDYHRYGANSLYSNNAGLIKVVRAYWRSYRKIGWLTTYDPVTDEPIIDLVDDNYKPKDELGEYVEWTVCNQIYTGAKILDGIYKDIGPYEDQIVDLDDLQYAPLPIEGCTYNDTNSKPYSLVDLMTPWNELYNIGAHELKELMKSSIGKVMFMSVDHIPNIPGFTMKKWYYWARKFKIAWVKQPKNGPNTFNQFSSADMSAFQSIAAIMDMLERIKQECDSIAGFSPGRVAAQSQEQTLGQSNQALTASVNQTEYLFFRHSKLIERILNQALNLSKNNLKDKTFLRNLFDDYEQAYIDFDADTVTNAKVGIYVTNSSDDQRKRMAMQQLMQPAMQNGADFMDLSEIIMSETISEVRQLGNKLRRNAKAARQADSEYRNKQLEIEQALKTRELDDKLTMSRERNEAVVESAYMKTFGGINASPHDDINDDGVPDVMEFANFNQKERDMFKKHMLAERKLNLDERKHKDTVRLDEKQLVAEERRTAAMAAQKKSR